MNIFKPTTDPGVTAEMSDTAAAVKRLCGIDLKTVPLTAEDIYAPDDYKPVKNEIRAVELTAKQAKSLGYSFHKKSKAVRITGYNGAGGAIVIPSRIDGMRVNEIGKRAFASARIESVEIPGSIRRIGTEAFVYSSIKRVTFGEGLREIPEMAFYSCKNLETVSLPTTLSVIGNSAFCACESLEYIVIPRSVGHIGSAAFNSSGLKGFAAGHYSLLHADGIAFAYTPMHRNYKLILSHDQSSTMDVLLVGYGAKIEFTGRIRLLKNSVCAACQLDFSRCINVGMRSAFCPESYNRQTVDMVLPQNVMDLAIPPRVCAVYPDGRRYADFAELVERNGGTVRVKFNGKLFTERTVEYAADNLIIELNGAAIQERVFNRPRLKRLELAGLFYPNGEIFSPKCAALREVCMTNDKGEKRVHYLPPSELAGERIHRGLLKAFSGKKRNCFFDRRVIDSVFQYGTDTLVRFGVYRPKPLNQRQRILLALDVLRSSPELYDNDTGIYSDYLRTHSRYAAIVCGRLSGNYPEYGKSLAAMLGNDK